MVGKTEFTEGIIAGLRAAKGNQCRVDAVYDELWQAEEGASVVHQGFGKHEEGAAS